MTQNSNLAALAAASAAVWLDDLSRDRLRTDDLAECRAGELAWNGR
jgi:hypothetical protein